MKPGHWSLCVMLVMLGLPVWAEDTKSTAAKIALFVDRFPVAGPTEGLEPQVLDFRYQPARWQTCIGLVDDPHKTIVGSDGGLYYEYGKQGPAAYDNGQGSFGTRVLAGFVGDAEGGPTQQSLHSPRIPLVISQREFGSWLVRQEAWSNRLQGPESTEPEEPGADRVDYLTMTASNRSAAADSGQVTLDVGATARLVLDAARQRLLIDGRDDQVFCQFSVPCEPLAEQPAAAAQDKLTIHSNASARIQKNWAQPQVDCASCFQHVLVGFGQPLVFRVPVTPGGRLQLALGLIEGWHGEVGRRPLRLSIEGTPQRDVDLVREHGKNVPVVLNFAAEDDDGDGTLLVEIMPMPEAEDGNTILSALWVFPADLALEPQDILQGKCDAQALARIDADAPPNMPRPIRLTWPTGQLNGGESFELMVALPQGDRARRQLTVGTPAVERQRCIEYWQNAGLPYDRIVVPDRAVRDLLDSCIRNIYQAREQKNGKPKFQVGPTCYRGTWAADGPFLLEAASYLGRLDEVRAGLEQQVDGDDGPGGVEFSKKSGLRLWMIRRHVQLTGDRQWLAQMWPRVEREVNQIIEYRATTRDNPNQANYGLMPIGFGDGGLGGKHREYTNVYWTLAGLRAAIELAELLQQPIASKWQAEYDDYWQTFDRARQRDKLVDAAGNTYVPVTMRGELPQLPQCGAWAFLQSIFPGRIFGSDDSLMRGTMDMLDANQREGLIFGTGWIADGIWNYAASFYAHAHLWLGHAPKAAATLYAFGNHASPLLCWREEQNPVGAPGSFVGDMPHNWASAEFIRLVRHLVILERGDELHLLEGLPQAWAKFGAELRMVEVPTSFGDVSLVMKVADDGRSAQIIVHSPGREPPAKMVVHLEGFERPIASVTVDGVPLDAHQTTVAPQRSSTITVTFESVRSAFDMPNRLKTYFEDMSVAKPFVVRTGESWEAHRQPLRAFLLECVGLAPLPERVPLDVRMSDTLDHPWCTVRRVSYQLWPGVYSTGLLFMPKEFRERPAPAVLCPHGHWTNCNAHPTVQTRCLNLARLGYVTFSSTQNHFEDQSLGVSHQTLMVWNNMRALDFLESLPEVDASRMGVAGASGGGLQTQMLVALDPRVKAATIAGLTCDFRQIMFADSSHCACNHFPNVMQRTDHPEISTLGLPCPVQYLTMNDWTKQFQSQNFPTIRQLYAAHGIEERVDCRYFDTGHDYDRPKREYTYWWLDRWLCGSTHAEPAAEPETATLPVDAVEQLVAVQPNDKGFREISRLVRDGRVHGAPQLATVRDWEARRTSLTQVLRELLGEHAALPRQSELLTAEMRRQDELMLEHVAFPSEGSIVVPAWVIRLENPAAERLPVEIILDGRGKDVMRDQAGDDSPQRRAKDGTLVVLPDLRTFGESFSTGTYNAAAQAMAWQRNSIVWGRPVAGMAVTDLQAVLDAIAVRPDADMQRVKIVANGSGDLAMAALFAMVLDARITDADLDLADACYDKRTLTLVPRVLLHGDVPEWASLVADRRLRLRNVPPEAGDLECVTEAFRTCGTLAFLDISP